MTYHNPVLLQPSLHYLAIRPGKKYIDATLGAGGHAKAIIEAGGVVLGLDQDQDAINACPDLDRLTKVQTNFSRLAKVAKAHGFMPVSGMLFDLGVSSWQIDTDSRGFSFSKEGPLDMRMDQTSGMTAATLVNQLPVKQLSSLFADFGEIPAARSLAVKIVANRPVTTTTQLARLTGIWTRQAFQALRIAVNDELGSLSSGLDQALDLLESRGRVVVIAFHSLEDRIVKDKFRAWQQSGKGAVITPKPVTADETERAENSRSYSAKLRAFEKL